MGKLAFSTIQQWFKLSTCMRQNSEDQQHFRNLLDEPAQGRLSTENYELLMSRRLSELSEMERSRFKNSMYLYATNPNNYNGRKK